MRAQLNGNRSEPTNQRVPKHTSSSVNRRIRGNTIHQLESIGNDRDKIEKRLLELDREWDIERTLEANAAAISLIGLGLGAFVNRKWFYLPATVAGFLLQHAIQGWCPPLPLFRRMGFRTQREIDNERTILKARRGDLKKINKADAPHSLLRMEI